MKPTPAAEAVIEHDKPTDTEEGAPGAGPKKPALLAVLENRNFRLLWIGTGVSMLGDTFYMIALPWLVLQLTGNALAVGTVMAAAGVPRALFMLVGGAVTDRFSPRGIMIISALLRSVLVALLTALVFTGRIELWMIYALAFTFGTVDAFSFPAGASMVPRLVHLDLLQGANALIQGTGQLTALLGPALAGGLIALLTISTSEGAGGTPGARGLAIAFGFNASTFLVSALVLWIMRMPKRASGLGEAGKPHGVWASIREGLATVWHDASLRALFIIIAAMNFLLTGPISIGIPVLANERLPEKAAAFGIVMSAFGGGALLGTLLVGLLPKPAARRLGITFILATAPIGLGAILLGYVTSTPLAALTTFAMGVGEGYVNILFITWLQRRMPIAILGRMMSLVMFASFGLHPFSMAITGALIDLNMTALFTGAGGIMLFVVIIAAFNPAVQAMGLAPPLPESNRPDAEEVQD